MDKYRSDIEGIRAVSIVIVILVHAFPELCPSGFIGVDIFFVVSGYLITGMLLADLKAASFSFLNFYARRARRIIPPLFIVLITVWGMGFFLLLPNEFAHLGEHLVAASSFSSNFLLWREASYFDIPFELKPLIHLWSLAVEEQFYLTWPVLLFLWHKKKWRLGPLFVGLFSLSISLNWGKIENQDWPLFYLFPTRSWELLAGGALAFFGRKERISFLHSWIFPWSGVFFLALGLLTSAEMQKTGSGLFALCPVLCALLLISANPNNWMNKKLLSHPISVFLGKTSYSLYLWHWVLLAFARILRGDTPPVELRLQAIGLAIVLAILTWYWVERPLKTSSFSQITSRSREWAFVLSGIGALAFSGFLGSIAVRHPRIGNLAGTADSLRANSTSSTPQVMDCRSMYGFSLVEQCRFFGDQPKLIFWGDSHAWRLFQGYSLLDKALSVSTVLLGKHSCQSFYAFEGIVGEQESRCAETFEKNKNLITREFKDARIAILSTLIPTEIKDPAVKRLDVGVLEEKLLATLSFLEAENKRVIMILDNPELDFDPSQCTRTGKCKRPREDTDKEQVIFRQIVARLKKKHPRLVTFDTVPLLCDDSYCYATRENTLIYEDRHHLTKAGASYLATDLVKLIQTLPEMNRYNPATTLESNPNARSRFLLQSGQ